MKRKKNELSEINEQLQEGIRNGSEKLYNYLTDFIDKSLKKTDEKFEEIIICEKECDRLKEKYIEILFKETIILFRPSENIPNDMGR